MKHKISNSNVSRETLEKINSLFNQNESKIKEYADLILWWNSRINLISRSITKNELYDHIKHSLLISEIGSFLKSNKIIDAGTGGGLPGIPLAINFPSKQFVLNDISSKKIMTVKQIVRDLNLNNIVTDTGSIGDIQISYHDDEFIIISKHAFKIDTLFNLTKDLNWQEMILLKGCNFKSELLNIPDILNVSCHHIEKGTTNPFYKDKCILRIHR